MCASGTYLFVSGANYFWRGGKFFLAKRAAKLSQIISVLSGEEVISSAWVGSRLSIYLPCLPYAYHVGASTAKILCVASWFAGNKYRTLGWENGKSRITMSIELVSSVCIQSVAAPGHQE